MISALGDADWSAVVGVCTLALTFLALPLLVVIGVWSPGSALRVLASHRDTSSFLIASLVLGVLVSWFATVIWNRVSRILPVSLAGQLVVFETLSSLLYAAIADRKVPPTCELGAMSIIVLGVVLAVRATSAVEAMGRSGEESSGSAEALAMVES